MYYVVCKRGFYLYCDNPHIVLWTEEARSACWFRCRVNAELLAQVLGGEVVELEKRLQSA